MITLLTWHVRALAWRLAGAWERRHMRRQTPPCERCGLTYCIGPRCPIDMPPPPRIIVVAVRANSDPHTATLRMRFATGVVPDGHKGPLKYHEYARIARAVRAEHQE